MGEGVTTTYYDLALHVVRPVTNYDLRLVVTKEYPVDTSYDISLEIAKAIKQGQDYDLALTISKVVALLQEYDLSLGVNKEVVLTTDYDLRCRVEKIISIQKDYDNALEVLKGKEYDLSLLVSKALAQTTDYDLALGVRKLGFFRWDADLEEWLEIDLGYVKLNQGDPQTIVNGNLSVNDPIDLYHVANKNYVKNTIASDAVLLDQTTPQTIIDGNVSVDDPVDPAHIANKRYVDTELALKANDADVVHDTGNETVAGIKTFSSFPVTPSSAPTLNYQVANKKYVDDNAGGGAPEGTAVKSTGETGGVKFLREDGDGTCSWQLAGGGNVPTSWGKYF